MLAGREPAGTTRRHRLIAQAERDHETTGKPASEAGAARPRQVMARGAVPPHRVTEKPRRRRPGQPVMRGPAASR
jgi:hypothetical protein